MISKLTKLMTLAGATLALGAGCLPANADSPIQILGAFPLASTSVPGECVTGDGDFSRSGGSIDVAAFESSSMGYLVAFSVINEMQRYSTTVGGDTLARTRNNFVANEARFQFATADNRPLDEQSLALHLLIEPATGADGSTVIVNLLPARTQTQLKGMIPPGGTPLDMSVTWFLNGRTASGVPITSNRVTYPITVFNSGTPKCADVAGVPHRFRRNGPCGNIGGQDGLPLE
jgi:hypothetical protein